MEVIKSDNCFSLPKVMTFGTVNWHRFQKPASWEHKRWGFEVTQAPPFTLELRACGSVQTTVKKCTDQEFQGRGAIRLAMNWVLHWPGFTVWPSLSSGELQAWMKTMTWLLTWQRFLLGEFSGGQVSWTTSNPWTSNLTYGELQVEGIYLL